MALNVATLKTRSLTAVVFVAVMLVGLLWNFWSFLILFTIVHFGCWAEYFKLVEKIHNVTIDLFIKRFFAFCGFTFIIVFGIQNISYDAIISKAGFSISLKLLFWFILMICLIAFVAHNKQVSVRVKQMFFAGFIYISLPLALLLNLRDNYFVTNDEFNLLDLGKIYVCAVIFSIWINDTMAYIVGSLIGKTPFSKISPKKTWEGTIGGAILCVVVIATIAYFTHLLLVKDAAIIAALCAIFGTIGDLFESKLKRMANVKDSGTIMPGHGGFLDRFDSLLFAAPAVWIYVKLFMI
ncbi:phosphatidate cytidylyltransferase [Ferruginibacter sp.]